MSVSQTHAILWIGFDIKKGELYVTEEAKTFFQSVHAPLHLVAVTGKCRTGKSMLINLLASKNRNLAQWRPFTVGKSIHSQTKGIYILPTPLYRPNGDVYYLVDTEGIYSLDAVRDDHDRNILMLSLLLCPTFVYNMMGSIDQQALEQLHIIVKVAQQLDKAVASSSSSAPTVDFEYPRLVWVLRDFSLRLTDKESGKEISPDQYLEHALSDTSLAGAKRKMNQEGEQPTEDPQRIMNETRQVIRSKFGNRHCAVLDRPMDSEEALQDESTAWNESTLKKRFLAQFMALSNLIESPSTPPKRFNGQMISGKTLLMLCEKYISALNQKQVPALDSYWGLVEKNCRAEAILTCRSLLTQKLKSVTQHLPLLPTELKMQLETFWRDMKQAVPLTQELGDNASFQEFMSEAEQSMDKATETNKEQIDIIVQSKIQEAKLLHEVQMVDESEPLDFKALAVKLYERVAKINADVHAQCIGNADALRQQQQQQQTKTQPISGVKKIVMSACPVLSSSLYKRILQHVFPQWVDHVQQFLFAQAERLKTMSNELEQKNKLLSGEVADLRAELEHVSASRSDDASKLEQLATVDLELRNKKHEHELQVAEIKRLREQALAKQAEFEQSMTLIKEQQEALVRNFQEREKQSKSELARLGKEALEREEAYKETSQQLQFACKQRDEFREREHALKEEVSRVHAQAREDVSRLHSEKETQSKEFYSKWMALTQDVSAERNRVRQLEEQARSLASSNTQLESKNALVSKEVVALRQQVQEQTKWQQEIKVLTLKVNFLNEDKERLQTEVDKRRQEISQLEERLDTARKDNSILKVLATSASVGSTL